MPDAQTPDEPAAGRGRAVTAQVGSDEYGRGISFFDAVYGFAITLLIANVDPPTAEEWTSLTALASSGLGSQLVGLALSFTVIAVFWRLNVRLMRTLRGMDGPTVGANLVAVGMILLIPFTTQGISDPHSSELPLPTALYALNIALASLAQVAVAQIGRARGLERIATTRRENLTNLLDALPVPVIFLASIPVALVAGAEPAKWTWASLIVLGPLSAALLHRRRAAASG